MGIENAKFQISAEDATAAAFNSVKRSLMDVQGAALSVKGALGGIMASGVIVGLTAAAKHAIDTADSLNKMSQKIGVSVESLSTLKYAAELSDLSLEGLGAGLKKLAVNMQGTEADAGDAKNAFAALKIGVEEAGGGLRTTEDVMLDIADKFANMEDGAGKTAFAVKLFGKSGMDLIPFLNQGRAGIQALTAEAEKLGLKLTGETSKAAEEFNDNLKAVKSASEGAWRVMMGNLLPGLVEVTQAMREGAKEGGMLRGVLEGLRMGFAKLFFDNTADKLKDINQQIALSTQKINALESNNTTGRPSAVIANEYKRLQDLYRRQGELEILKEYDEPATKPDRPKSKAPPLPGKAGKADKDKDKAEKLSEARWLAKQLDEGEDEWIKTLTEAQKAYADFANKQLDTDKQIEADRIEAIWKNYDIQQEADDELQREFHRNTKSMHEERDEAARKGVDVAKELGLTFSSAFEDAIAGGKGFRDVLKGIEQDIIRIVARKTITEPLAEGVTGLFKGLNLGGLFSGSPGGGSAAGWTSGFDLPGFASGGSFTVGGAGGTDSKLVSFMATPGERVNVQTSGQRNAGGDTYIIDARGADSAGMARLETMILQLNGSIERRAVAATMDGARRGGAAHRYLGR